MASCALVMASLAMLWSTMRSLGQCERVQLLREQDNRESAVIYRVLSRVPDPYLRSLSRRVTYTPPTDCQAAALDPLGYDPPRPIPFTEMSDARVDLLVPPPSK